jgi:anti-sigma factor RsiW
MTERECETIRDLLVDYADGELAAADGQRVAAHLESCPDCRAEMRLLQRSLEVARAVWHELAAVEHGLPSPLSGELAAVQYGLPSPLSGEGQGVRASGELAITSSDCPSAVVAAQVPPQHVAVQLPAQQLVGLAALGPPYEQRGWRWRLAAPALAAAIVLVLVILPWLVPHGGAPLATRPTAGPSASAAGDSPEPATMSREEIERYIAREASAARLCVAAELLGTQPGLEEHQRRAEQYIIATYGDTSAGRELSARAAPKPTKEPQS